MLSIVAMNLWGDKRSCFRKIILDYVRPRICATIKLSMSVLFHDDLFF